MTMYDIGGRGVSQIMNMYDEGGGGGLDLPNFV